jgi:hypothetical protein
MKMLDWKHVNMKFGFLLGFVLFLSACAAAEEEAQPQPSVAPVVSPTADIVQEAAPEATATAPAQLAEETDSPPTRIPADKYADLEIVTLLPRDAIPAVDDPQFLTASEADDFYDPEELVIGVEFDGDARAYSIPYLSNREIVNDVVGGVKIAVTW